MTTIYDAMIEGIKHAKYHTEEMNQLLSDCNVWESLFFLLAYACEIIEHNDEEEIMRDSAIHFINKITLSEETK